MTSRWNERTLTSEGTTVNASGSSATVTEAYSVSSDGKVLTIDITTTAPDAKSSALKYVRLASVGGCESWPTPCKR